MSRRRLKRSATCGKVRFRDETDAGIALAMVRRKRNGLHVEQRSYYCGRCRGYHLTSTPARWSEL